MQYGEISPSLPHSNTLLIPMEQRRGGFRTAEYKSPYELFTAGALELQQSGLRGLDFFENVDENYGVEEMGLPSEQSSYQDVSN